MRITNKTDVVPILQPLMSVVFKVKSNEKSGFWRRTLEKTDCRPNKHFDHVHLLCYVERKTKEGEFQSLKALKCPKQETQ